TLPGRRELDVRACTTMTVFDMISGASPQEHARLRPHARRLAEERDGALMAWRRLGEKAARHRRDVLRGAAVLKRQELLELLVREERVHLLVECHAHEGERGVFAHEHVAVRH